MVERDLHVAIGHHASVQMQVRVEISEQDVRLREVRRIGRDAEEDLAPDRTDSTAGSPDSGCSPTFAASGSLVHHVEGIRHPLLEHRLPRPDEHGGQRACVEAPELGVALDVGAANAPAGNEPPGRIPR